MANYNPAERETHRQSFWLENNIYAFDPTSPKPLFSVDTPPPTVSGKLHIGHIFSYTQAECLVRYKRMAGYNVYYPMGYDDNGIPTEQLVEKETGVNSRQISRQEFWDLCLATNEKFRASYKQQRMDYGFSCDRKQTYATITPEVQQIAQQRFVQMVRQGHIVTKVFPALRCTKTQSTTAQAETEEKEIDSIFFDVRFGVKEGGEIIIATTRPELMPAIVAVFVHPDDEKYQGLVGKTAVTPFGDEVTIMTDEKVKMDKGSGAVMCCTYGDETDVYRTQKYHLQPKIIINRYGKIENSHIESLNGLKVDEARVVVANMLREKGAVVKETPIRQSVSFSERGKVRVEIIPIKQRFVNTIELKDTRHRRNDEMKRIPAWMQKRSTDRIDSLSWDWNISRNRTFGIPIPVRYSLKTGELILPTDAQLTNGAIDPSSQMPDALPAGHTRDDIEPETMVLDTWFTSGITPDINQYIAHKNGFVGSLLPMSLRVQAHDIIRTRLFYTTIHAHYAHDSKPFETVMMSGHVLAAKGEKISKSKGNAKVEPDELLEKWGADPVRYWALSGQLGKDIIFDENMIKNGNKLVMKLRNVANFLQMTGCVNTVSQTSVSALYPTDQWILSRLQETIAVMRKQLDSYEIGLAKIAFEDFFRSDVCDMYLEMVKTRLYKPDQFTDGLAKQQSAQQTLYVVFFNIIKLIAPYLPHITEEIYQGLFRAHHDTHSIHIMDYPSVQSAGNHELNAVFALVSEIISAARGYKTQHQLSLGAELAKIIITIPADQHAALLGRHDDIIGATKALELEVISGEKKIEVVG